MNLDPRQIALVQFGVAEGRTCCVVMIDHLRFMSLHVRFTCKSWLASKLEVATSHTVRRKGFLSLAMFGIGFESRTNTVVLLPAMKWAIYCEIFSLWPAPLRYL